MHVLGYPIVTGCHNTHRVTALRQVGGFAPHAADDLLMTLHYSVGGWKGVHGLYYLQSNCVGLQLLLPAFMLCTGITPHAFSFFTLPRRSLRKGPPHPPLFQGGVRRPSQALSVDTVLTYLEVEQA
jgi:hypothetical protein